MKKGLKRAFYIMAGLTVIVLVAPLLMPSKYVASSTVTIRSNVYTVYPLIGDLKNWEKWISWKDYDPSAPFTFSTNTFGAGSTMNWTSTHKNLGTGKITTTQFKKYESINYGLEFFQPFQTKSSGRVSVKVSGDKEVQVTMTNTSRLKWPFERWVNLFMNFEKRIEKDFDKSLGKLKTLAESAPLRELPSVNPEKTVVPDQLVFSVLQMDIPNSLVSQKIGESYANIHTNIEKSGAEIVPDAPPICLFYSHSTSKTTFEPAIPVLGCQALQGDVICKPIKGGPALRFAYYGPYSQLELTYDAIHMYLDKNKITQSRDYTWEAYITDPGLEPDSAKWLTYIYVPVKE